MTEPTSMSPEGAADVIVTEYRVGQDNLQPKLGPFSLDIHNPVFVISGATIIAFVFLSLFYPLLRGSWAKFRMRKVDGSVRDED